MDDNLANNITQFSILEHLEEFEFDQTSLWSDATEEPQSNGYETFDHICSPEDEDI